MVGHRVPLDQFYSLLLAQLPDDPSDTSAELPIEDPASVLRHKNNVILAVPADVRLALPVSHENLLPSERGGSLKGGSLLHSAARRNSRASASLTARGGGLPVGANYFGEIFMLLSVSAAEGSGCCPLPRMEGVLSHALRVWRLHPRYRAL